MQRIVEESGDPCGFDAQSWTAKWLQDSVPALGGACPASYMGTLEGRMLIKSLLMQEQGGAYS